MERSEAHAKGCAALITEMDPEYAGALTLTVIPGTPQARMVEKGQFELPEIPQLLREMRTIVEHARPTKTVFRTNHASSYLPIAGELPRDREHILHAIDLALGGEIPLKPEFMRGL